MAAIVHNGNIIRNMDGEAFGVWLFETFAGWTIENEWTMSTGCQVTELYVWREGICHRDTVYYWG